MFTGIVTDLHIIHTSAIFGIMDQSSNQLSNQPFTTQAYTAHIFRGIIKRLLSYRHAYQARASTYNCPKRTRGLLSR